MDRKGSPTQRAALKKARLLKGLTSSELEAVRGLARTQEIAAGETVFSEGSYGDDLHILTRGMVRIELTIDDEREDTTIQRFTAGQVFGEISLADRRNRSATACCETDCEIVTIPCADLRGLFENDYRVGYVVMKNLAAILATRLRKTNTQLISTILWE